MVFKATEIRLDPGIRSTLEGWLRAKKTEQRLARRARIVLLAAEGMASRAIAREVGVMTGIDKPRPGAKRVYGDATDKRILTKLDEPPPIGRARWDGKLLAKALGDVDVNDVRRFLHKQKIDLAGRKSRCESKDPEFAAKAADVVALYMSRPRTRSCCVSTRSRRSRRWGRAQGYLKLPT